jgi:hypothetical protein
MLTGMQVNKLHNITLRKKLESLSIHDFSIR